MKPMQPGELLRLMRLTDGAERFVAETTQTQAVIRSGSEAAVTGR
jgi:hypothetical protein